MRSMYVLCQRCTVHDVVCVCGSSYVCVLRAPRGLRREMGDVGELSTGGAR